MKLKLSRKERSAILRGDYTALRRDKPYVKAGDTLVVSMTRGGRQIVDYDTGDTVDISRQPTVWLVFEQPVLKEGVWVLRFRCEDHRQQNRVLMAGAPSGVQRESGLKTRWRAADQVPSKEAYRESWTSETERGYGGGGAAALDDNVPDDAWYREDRIRREMDAKNAQLQANQRNRQEILRGEARLNERRKAGKTRTANRIEKRVVRLRESLDEAA